MSIYFGQGPDAEVTPKSLYVLTATLIKHGLLTLDEIYPHVCNCMYHIRDLLV